jgi:hypothetical protein
VDNGDEGVKRRLTFLLEHRSEFRFADVPRITDFVWVEVERDVFGGE